jgi:hypothetical protein
LSFFRALFQPPARRAEKESENNIKLGNVASSGRAPEGALFHGSSAAWQIDFFRSVLRPGPKNGAPAALTERGNYGLSLSSGDCPNGRSPLLLLTYRFGPRKDFASPRNLKRFPFSEQALNFWETIPHICD